MAELNFDARRHAPSSHYDRVPAEYSKLTPAGRIAVRERYVALQAGKCWHCQHDLDNHPAPYVLAYKINWHAFPGRERGFLKHPVHLHHDHTTDLTIGAVHAYCNAVLWQHHGE